MARRWSAILALVAGLASCGGHDTAGPTGTSVSVTSGDAQSFPVGTAAPAPLSVVVRDGAGAPMNGVAVVWAVASGGGTVTPQGLTDGSGTAIATYAAGTTSGAKTITATVAAASGPHVTFTLTVQPGPARRLVRAAGDAQTGFAGNTLPVPLTVQVVDSFGNGVPGIAVTWSVVSGTATLGATSVPSDSLGRAATTVTLAAVGAVSVAAGAASLAGSPVAFGATATIPVSLVAEVPVPANYGQHDQFIRAGLAFLCSWNTGLQIYDVGDGRAGGSPQNPKLISALVTAGGAVHNAWWYWAPGGQKNYVFVGQEGPGSIGSSSSGDIHVVDISNLGAPVEVAHYHMANNAGTHNFWVDEAAQVLYAAYYNGGVVALNIAGTLSGDLATREIARIQPGGAGNTYVWGVMLAGGSLYATDMLSGFWQLKLVGGAFQVLGGGNNVPERYGSDQWVAGGYAYSGTWGARLGRAGNALKVWKLTAAGAPVLQDSIVTPGFSTVSDVEVSADGRLLMFSAEIGPTAGLYFYSLVADPGHPTFIGYYAVTANGQNGIHTATFADIGGKRYVFAAKDPPSPSMMVLDVTAIGP
jgi:hypothetical protein